MEKQFEKMIELKYEAVKNRIAEIERLLDDDSTTDEEFDALMLESQHQTALLGELERSMRLKDVNEITPNEWTVNLLKSFGTTSITRVISAKQYDVLKRINDGKPFKYNSLRYDISKGNNNFGTLIVTECM